ncbi:ferredoxin [Calocera cornea HHB12733]|uniref:Ferredoxin n=1 Tax=Calocera cornea HHB12733 TaxID=1353952 RepID=A0A165HG23_9BASI|nr:ferredoxin [Calocera cornea HHB12733]
MHALARTAGAASRGAHFCSPTRTVTRCVPSTSAPPRIWTQHRSGLLHSSAAHSNPAAAARRHAHLRHAPARPPAPSAPRSLHTSAPRHHGPLNRPAPGTGIKVTFQDSKGQPIRTVEANEGDNLLDIAHEYDIDLEGACEGSVACSTCHVILRPETYDALPEPSDEENDMLDMAFGLTDTSRLGCQVKVTRELDGLVATLPSATRNMFVDGERPLLPSPECGRGSCTGG